MTKTNRVKKIKQSKTPVKKLEKKLKKKKLEKAQQELPDNNSDSDSSLPESEKLQDLLEPYSKEQLVDLIVDAAVKDSSLYQRIRDTADRDVAHRKIFVHGLGWDTTRETLTEFFEVYGEIEDCNVVTDRNTGKAKGYGFVLFKERRATMKALKEPRKKINNRVASCQLASSGPVPPSESQDTSGRKVYVSNVHSDVDPEKLRSFFAKFGEIETGPIGFDMETGKSRGYALFVYKTKEGVRKALEEPNKTFDGYQLHCQRAFVGKNKAAVQPVQAPVLAAMPPQNMMFNQQQSLNPMYSGLFAHPTAGFMSVNPLMAAGALNQGFLPSSQVGQVGGSSLGNGTVGLGSFGGTPSVLGAYGSSSSQLGLQHAYSNTPQASSSGAHPSGGSFSGYPSYIR